MKADTAVTVGGGAGEGRGGQSPHPSPFTVPLNTIVQRAVPFKPYRALRSEFNIMSIITTFLVTHTQGLCATRFFGDRPKHNYCTLKARGRGALNEKCSRGEPGLGQVGYWGG